MPAALPTEWLQAQADSWPLRSVFAFDTALTEPDNNARRALSADFEGVFRTRAAGMSLDTLHTLVRGSWEGLQGRDSLRRHLERVADGALAWAGDRVVLRGADEGVRALVRWRWLSLSLPPDLLVASLAARHGHAPRTETATLPDRGLARVFAEKPFAVTHLHVGASVPFGPLWAGVMRRMAGEERPRLKPDPTSPGPLRTEELFCSRLLQAAIARVVLASYLWHRDVGACPADGCLGEFLTTPAATGRGLAAACRRVRWPGGPDAAARVLAQALRGLTEPTEETGRWKEWHGVYRNWVAPPPPVSQRYADVAAADPLAGWLAPAGSATPETRFATRALGYLAGRADDGAFTTLFWQYQRVRVLTYLYLVEERGTAGLEWFSRHYQRISGLREPYDDFLFEAAFATEGRGVALRSLEGRTSPPDEWGEVRDMAREIARNALRMCPSSGSARPEVGLVLHFIKERQFTAGGREWDHADPAQPVYRCRFGRWFAGRLRQADAIARALERHPELLCIIRGVDVANVELAVPSWAVAPLIRATRRASHEAAAECGRRWPGWEVEPLRATWHAGEDFTRLAQGLRAIHEPIEAGAIWSADRLGHAFALGLRPGPWAEAAGTVPQAAEDRLDDLLWEWDRYAAGDIPPQAGRLMAIEREIERLASHVYAVRDHTVPTFARARRLRLQPGILRELDYLGPGWRRHRMLRLDGHADDGVARRPAPDLGGEAEQARGLFRTYLRDAGTHARGREIVRVEADATELIFLEAAQRWLAGHLEALSITVETNPSSNLLIADFADLREHPAFRLEPLHADDPEALGVAITINSDNPLTFATSLGDEFTYMYAGLRRAGVTGGAALGWLDRVREAAWRARFTLPSSAEPAILDRIAGARNARRR
ncbi:MAG TPA: hypothetical protein VNP72_01405 [Longimicrobium sp.]|nr:hypothetical protein [Longimicrobium sp.]